MKSDELDLRSQDILRQAIHTFIISGEPVGSRTLAKLNPEGLSPATIRNIMADLEEWGFIGSFLTVVVFLLLIVRILVLAERQKNQFSRMYGYAVGDRKSVV